MFCVWPARPWAVPAVGSETGRVLGEEAGAGRREAEATVTLGPQLHSPLGQHFVPSPAAVFSHDPFQMVCRA